MGPLRFQLEVSSNLKLPISIKRLRAKLRALAGELSRRWRELEGRDVVLYLMGEQRFKKLRGRYMGEAVSSDVLSLRYQLPRGRRILLGEIYVNVPRVMRNAKRYKRGFEEELFFVIAHGALHLLNYDDSTPREQELMFALQEQILRALAILLLLLVSTFVSFAEPISLGSPHLTPLITAEVLSGKDAVRHLTILSLEVDEGRGVSLSWRGGISYLELVISGSSLGTRASYIPLGRARFVTVGEYMSCSYISEDVPPEALDAVTLTLLSLYHRSLKMSTLSTYTSPSTITVVKLPVVMRVVRNPFSPISLLVLKGVGGELEGGGVLLELISPLTSYISLSEEVKEPMSYKRRKAIMRASIILTEGNTFRVRTSP